MDVNKIRNLTDIELAHQQRELSDQLFKMKFQLKMVQTESLKKIRELKKDIARVKTVMRQKQIAGGNGAAVKAAAVSAPAPAKKSAKKKAATEKKDFVGSSANQHSKDPRPSQDPDRRSGLHQDGQDHRDRSPTAEGPPVLQAGGGP